MDVLKKVPVREQDAKVRAANFEEVCLGYNREEAMEEASRCINCKNAQCVKGCPVSINIPGFIEKVKEGDMEAAYQVISASSPFLLSADVSARRRASARENVSGDQGRAHFHRKAGALRGRLGQRARASSRPALRNRNGNKVAVIGSGPAGLTCAGDLAKMGYDVTIFEALHRARRRSGIRYSGIPSSQGSRREEGN